MKTHKFARKTFYVDAVRVSEANIEEVATWCNGTIEQDETGHTFLKVEVLRPLTERQEQAYIGDWVLGADRGFKVYTPKAFEKQFEKVKYLSKDQADAAGIKPPHEPRPASEQKPVHGNKEQGIDLTRKPVPTPPKKRGGTPLTNNVGEKLKEAQAKADKPDVDHRSAETGQYVSEETAETHPDTTVAETREPKVINDATIQSVNLVSEEPNPAVGVHPIESVDPTVAGKTKADIEAEKMIAEVNAIRNGPGN